jgi:RND family efflux transporter MFP subunit
MISKTLLGAAALLLLLAPLAAPSWAASPTKAQYASPTTPVANVASLDTREVRAQLMPKRYTTLAAEIGAKVNRMPVAEGARFRAGENLISFDCVVQHAQLDRAKAALAAVQTTWTANRRLNELHSVSQVELDVSAAEVAKAKAEVAINAAIVSKCVVAAPFAGKVAEQKVREQQYVQPGQPLLEILDDSALELEFIVPSKWLTWLKPDQSFQVAIDETGKTYPAKVKRIGAHVDPVSQSVKLSAVIDGKFAELMAGMSGKVLMAPAAR